MPTHYEILGVSIDANDSEIKSSYRKLSLKHHPDRVEPHLREEAKTRIQEINMAYEILGDSEKRAAYDHELKYGVPSHPGDMGDLNEIFNMFFGGGMPGMHGMPGMGMPGGIHVFHMGGNGPHGFHGGFGNHMFEQLQKPPPLIKNVQLTLEHAYHGGNFTFDLERSIVRDGMRMVELEKITVDIPRGISDNDVILKRGCGNANSESNVGDLKLMISIIPNPDFERIGLDLVHKRKISLKEALCGFSFEIKHFNGKPLHMNNMSNPVIAKPGFKKVVPGLGMIREGKTGNLIIEFDVVFPDSLSEEKIALLKDIL